MSDFWHGRRVLVTGATGLMGSWLVSALVRSRAVVTGLSRGQTRHAEPAIEPRSGGAKLIAASVTDVGVLRDIFETCRPETVFHLAAQALNGTARQDPTFSLDSNIRGTWTVLETCREYRVSQAVIASSCGVYGESNGSALNEDAPLRGSSPYSQSKKCAELIAIMYARNFGLATGLLRFSNVFGGGDLQFSRLIPGTIRSTLRSEPCQIRGSGRDRRDFLYVEDAVASYLLLAEALAKDPSLAGQVFNIGQGLTRTVLEITNIILTIMRRPDLLPVVQNQQCADSHDQVLDIAKAHSTLGWRRRISLEEGIDRTVKWYRANYSSQSEILTGTAPQTRPARASGASGC